MQISMNSLTWYRCFVPLFCACKSFTSPYFVMMKGRRGKGNIYVFSAGNGGPFNATCSYYDYVTSIYTIGISVVTGKNVPSRQNEKCAAISAVAYSRDGALGINYPHDLMVSLFVYSIKPEMSIVFLYLQMFSYQGKIKPLFVIFVTSTSTFICV